jgi:hypothetical protein
VTQPNGASGNQPGQAQQLTLEIDDMGTQAVCLTCTPHVGNLGEVQAMQSWVGNHLLAHRGHQVLVTTQQLLKRALAVSPLWQPGS